MSSLSSAALAARSASAIRSAGMRWCTCSSRCVGRPGGGIGAAPPEAPRRPAARLPPCRSRRISSSSPAQRACRRPHARGASCRQQAAAVRGEGLRQAHSGARCQASREWDAPRPAPGPDSEQPEAAETTLSARLPACRSTHMPIQVTTAPGPPSAGGSRTSPPRALTSPPPSSQLPCR